MRVVVAEDSAPMRAVVTAMLKRGGATEVYQAEHGGEAWDLIRSKDVDLVMTDWLMPVMDGLALIDRIRQTPGFEKLPVLLFTSQLEREDVIRALKAGADGFLAKPFKRHQLAAKVRHVLGRRPARRVERVIMGTDPLEKSERHPLVIIGESAVTAERLSRPDNKELLNFLASATDAVHFVSTRTPDVHIGYLLEASSSDISKRLRTLRQRTKLLLLDTDMGAGAMTLARLASVNRPADMAVYLICESFSEFTPKVRFGLERMDITILERHTLDVDAIESILAEEIVARQRESGDEVAAEMLSPDEVAKRLDGDLRNMVDLPVLPQVYQRIVELDKDPDSELDDWIEAIEADPLTRAQVIRRARSPLYGFRGEISETSKAVILLGKKPVKEIVVSGAVKRSLEKVQEAGFSVEHYWVHSVATAVTADMLSFPMGQQSSWTPDQKQQFEEFELSDEGLALFRDKELWSKLPLAPAHDPFVAGVMHDIGRVALAVGYPGLFAMILQETKEKKWATPLREAEATFTGSAGHTLAGAILADSWKLGEDIQEVIRGHHAEKTGNAFANLIAIADFIAGGIYPFPAESEAPAKGLFAANGPAVDDALKERLRPFLSEFLLPQYGLRLDDLVELGRACEPTVRKIVENLRSSAGGGGTQAEKADGKEG